MATSPSIRLSDELNKKIGLEWIQGYTNLIFAMKTHKNINKTTMSESIRYIDMGTYEEAVTVIMDTLALENCDFRQVLKDMLPAEAEKYLAPRHRTAEIYKQATSRKYTKMQFFNIIWTTYLSAKRHHLLKWIAETENIEHVEDFRAYLHLDLENFYVKFKKYSLRPASLPTLIDIAITDEARYAKALK